MRATSTDRAAGAEFDKRYAQILKTYGITDELRATEGAAESLRLVSDRESGVDVAFAQGGARKRLHKDADSVSVAHDDDEAGLAALVEPGRLFDRTDSGGLLKAPARTSLSRLPASKLRREGTHGKPPIAEAGDGEIDAPMLDSARIADRADAAADAFLAALGGCRRNYLSGHSSREHTRFGQPDPGKRGPA